MGLGDWVKGWKESLGMGQEVRMPDKAEVYNRMGSLKEANAAINDRFDHRQGAIEALQADAVEKGITLPQDFIDGLYSWDKPMWHTSRQTTIPFFMNDGSINPDVYPEVLEPAKNEAISEAVLGIQARDQAEAAKTNITRGALLDAYEQKSGIKIPQEVRQNLSVDGTYAFTSDGKHREINLNVADSGALIDEIAELSGALGHGQNVDLTDVAVQHAAALKSPKDQCRS